MDTPARPRIVSVKTSTSLGHLGVTPRYCCQDKALRLFNRAMNPNVLSHIYQIILFQIIIIIDLLKKIVFSKIKGEVFFQLEDLTFVRHSIDILKVMLQRHMYLH